MSILDRIVETKRNEVAGLASKRVELHRAAESEEPARPFGEALRLGSRVALLAEVKRKSPSAGWIRPEASAVEVAGWYERAGASAISVLTDREYFGGSLEDLGRVRASVDLPVLRKDFVVDPLQVWEARAAGADAILLIVRILEEAVLSDLLALSEELGMDALVEVHDDGELDTALAVGAKVIGVNNRDLATFHTDLTVTERLAKRIPEDRVLVAESGIRTASDVDRLGRVGADAVLVGESLMREAEPAKAAAALVGRRRRGDRHRTMRV
jgi:indole-3-glycerol phosphate synthase